MLAWVAAHQFLLIGIVCMVVIGPAVGNYACSVVYRLPRGKTPFERHPFCGHCNADLKPIEGVKSMDAVRSTFGAFRPGVVGELQWQVEGAPGSKGGAKGGGRK